MIDVNQAVEIVTKHFSEARPKEIYKYKDKFYMIVAPASENDPSDPFYIVNISNGDYRFLNPLEDIGAFNKALESGPIKRLK